MTSFNLVTQRIKDTLLLCDRLQRCTMIENLKFHERLMAAVGMSDGYVFNGISADCYQNMALDILLWISGVQMNDPFKRQDQHLRKYVNVVIYKLFLLHTECILVIKLCYSLSFLYLQSCD